MARVGRFATCNVSTPSSGAEGRGAGACGGFTLGLARGGRRVDSSSGRLPTHDAATASTARWRFAGGSAGALQSGISSSDESDMALLMAAGGSLCAVAHGCRQADGLLWAYCRLTMTTFLTQSSRAAVLKRFLVSYRPLANYRAWKPG